MKNIVLKNKNHRVYLKLYDDGYKHYVADFKEATRFDKKGINKVLKTFKHPENWEAIKTVIEPQKKVGEYKCTRDSTNEEYD